METILSYSAWTMTQPQPWGFFHILILVIGVPITIFIALKTRKISLQHHILLLFFIGIVLIIMEVYKQFFHYCIVNHGCYDWWIFPFQLCSIPMYLCCIMPFLHTKNQERIETFLMDFTLLGASMALLFPNDMMHSYVTLTAHSFLWHFLLLFIGFHIAFYRKHFAPYKQVILLFLLVSFLAFCFNILFHSFGDINMFYISPYMPFSQPVFQLLEPYIGRTLTIIIYLICACGGALCIQKTITFLHNHIKTPI